MSILAIMERMGGFLETDFRVKIKIHLKEILVTSVELLVSLLINFKELPISIFFHLGPCWKVWEDLGKSLESLKDFEIVIISRTVMWGYFDRRGYFDHFFVFGILTAKTFLILKIQENCRVIVC